MNIQRYYQDLGDRADQVITALRDAGIHVWLKVVDPDAEGEIAIWLDGVGDYEDLALLWHHTTGWFWAGRADSAHPDTTEVFEDLAVDATAAQVTQATADLLAWLRNGDTATDAHTIVGSLFR